MITIVGAGMAGLLAASMLSHRDDVTVVESQTSLPNNHGALLRFRSSIVGEVLGIPFRKVPVVKSYIPWRNPVADVLSYSMKNLGESRSDRSMKLTTELVERWIAPPDLVQRMYDVAKKRGVRFIFGRGYVFGDTVGSVISTIPMPHLMNALAYPLPHPQFGYVPGVNVHAKIANCDAYVSLAVPSPDLSYSRVSITGDDLIVEVPRALIQFDKYEADHLAMSAASLLGIAGDRLGDITFRRQAYSKIAPIPEEERRKFIFWSSTVTGQSYSLGRFATWRPGLLLDDVVNDVRVIEKLMDAPHDGYAAQQMELRKS